MAAEIRSVIDTAAGVVNGLEGRVLHYDPPLDAARGGIFAGAERLFSEPLQELLSHEYARGLFRHQRRAIELIMRRKNTVVTTRTSSGKSLIYSLPILESLLRHPSATSLLIYPQKALANDQLHHLCGLVDRVPALQQRRLSTSHLISRYDGATPEGIRSDIRRSAQVLLTNPDMLHVGILQWHEKHWARFVRNLRYVVLDECHEYRGIFGSNVAYVARRLRQLCELYGSHPTFIASSATAASPAQHLEKLTGLEFTSIGSEQDGSRQGPRKLWMVSNDEHFYWVGCRAC